MERRPKQALGQEPPPSRRGRPCLTNARALSRQQVVAAVVRLANERKDVEISMRDLAQVLGVSPKLLYQHVNSKDELLDLAAAAILQSWEPPASTLPWQERLDAVVASTRALVRRYPALSRAVLLRNLEARDSPETAKVVALVKSCFEDAGLAENEVIQMFLVYETLILGELALLQAVRDKALSSANMPGEPELNASFEMALNCAIVGVTAGRTEPR